jgi:hypothetical protein
VEVELHTSGSRRNIDHTDLFNKCDNRRIGRGEARHKINEHNTLNQLCSTNWGHSQSSISRSRRREQEISLKVPGAGVVRSLEWRQVFKKAISATHQDASPQFLRWVRHLSQGHGLCPWSPGQNAILPDSSGLPYSIFSVCLRPGFKCLIDFYCQF